MSEKGQECNLCKQRVVLFTSWVKPIESINELNAELRLSLAPYMNVEITYYNDFVWPKN